MDNVKCSHGKSICEKKKVFCIPTNLDEKGVEDLQMYFNKSYEGKLQAWNLGAAIAYKSTDFVVILPDKYRESWFTAGRIAGITIGCVAFVGIVIGVIILLVIIKKRRSQDVELDEGEGQSENSP